MIPYQSIRRRSLGDAPRVRHERLVREIHTVRTFANCLYAAGASFIFVEAGAPLGYLGWAWFVSLVLPSVFTFFALRSSGPQAFIIKSMLAECGVVAVVYLASGFSTFVVFWGALLMAINALMTAGTIAGVVGLFAPGIVATVLAALGFPVGDGEISALSLGMHAGAVLIYVFLNAAMGYQAMTKISSLRREIQSLNQKIREQVLVRYLPPDLISDIFDGKISMDTKPHAKRVTVLFSDLSGFTKLSEKHGAEVVSEFLNDYLTIMNDTIFGHMGTIDKFIGDAIMVIFGAPHDMNEEEQARHACQCAIAMQKGMALVNEKWKPRGLEEVSMRIGIHQGKAVVGNFGSKQRVDYTAIGPSVNLASRIENACEPGSIYVSQEVRELFHDDPPTDLAGEFELKGIEGKTSLYRLVDWG